MPTYSGLEGRDVTLSGTDYEAAAEGTAVEDETLPDGGYLVKRDGKWYTARKDGEVYGRGYASNELYTPRKVINAPEKILLIVDNNGTLLVEDTESIESAREVKQLLEKYGIGVRIVKEVN